MNQEKIADVLDVVLTECKLDPIALTHTIDEVWQLYRERVFASHDPATDGDYLDYLRQSERMLASVMMGVVINGLIDTGLDGAELITGFVYLCRELWPCYE